MIINFIVLGIFILSIIGIVALWRSQASLGLRIAGTIACSAAALICAAWYVLMLLLICGID